MIYVDAPSGQCCQCWVHFRKIYFRNTFLRLLVQHKLGLKRGGICDPSLGIQCKFRESAPQSENLCLSVLWPAGDPVQLASGRKCKRGDVCIPGLDGSWRDIWLVKFASFSSYLYSRLHSYSYSYNLCNWTWTGRYKSVHLALHLHQQGSWR